MKLLNIVIGFCSSLLVLGKATNETKINNKEILNSLDNEKFLELLSARNDEERNDVIESLNNYELDKRGGWPIPIPGLCGGGHPACENYWYCSYCSGMEAIYSTTCVPYCESNSEKGKKYKNKDACKLDVCGDHWECHKDCFA